MDIHEFRGGQNWCFDPPLTRALHIGKHQVCSCVHEFENIAPTLRKDDLYSSQREIIRQLKHMANKICRDSIPSDYINKAFNKFKQGYVYYDTNGMTVGFCIWSVKTMLSKSEKDRHVLYIYLICGNRMTQYICNTIFPDVELFCRKHNIDAIQLEPANDFLKAYYESYGFELTDTFSYRMTKTISYSLVSHTMKTRKYKRNLCESPHNNQCLQCEP